MLIYTIRRALLLSLGAVSIIARSLPGRRSEINARVAGGHESSNTLKNPEVADVKVDTAVSSATTNIDDLKHLFERMGLVMISEGMLGENFYARTYSITANTTFSIGGTTLEKREKNIEGGKCTTVFPKGAIRGPNPDDCAMLYDEVYGWHGQVRGWPRTVVHHTKGDCTVWFVNLTDDTLVYDFWDLAGTTQWLDGACIQNNAKAAACVFEEYSYDSEDHVFIVVSHPNFIDSL